MRQLLILLLLIPCLPLFSQQSGGLLSGTVTDEKKKPLQGASVELISYTPGQQSKTGISAEDGGFTFSAIPYGYYKLQLSFTGLQTLTIDSIHFREERADFNMDDLVLRPKSSQNLNEIVVYAEKPLIQSEGGNITFNAGESALSAGSNASDLLESVPMVSKDGDGKITVKGKEPKILIDDKPVEMNMQQLQDLLESMPGSSIEKIEVMTNPPAQYAMEEGGVINIVTKKGRVGKSGRITVNAGSRGDRAANANFNYRKNGFALNVNGGASQNTFKGSGYSIRQNFLKDSTNFFNSTSQFKNQSTRPNFRINADYDLNKQHSLNAVVQWNNNNFENRSGNEYQNLNRRNELYKLNQRSVQSGGNNSNWSGSLTYTWRTRKPGEVLRVITSANGGHNENNRYFFQQFFHPDRTPTGADSTQQQLNNNKNQNYTARINYDLPLKQKTTFLSLGSVQQLSVSNILVDASYTRKSDGALVPQTGLSNHFRFQQYYSNYRASIKQVVNKGLSFTAGMSAEATNFEFELYKNDSSAQNRYWSFLPFANINKKWEDILSITASYRRTIRRPGINELNPTRDESDPYNIRFGNPELRPSLAHNFDLVFGKNKTGFYTNLGFGYNLVEDIYSQLRDRINDNTTLITWQNISNRQEYEVSTWNGYTINKAVRVNLSASYRYNVYGKYEKERRSFRNGGSFTSNLNTNVKWSELYNTTASFTFNQFANPQGTARSNMSMNLGMQARLLQKKLIVTANIIDPFTQQQNRRFTYGNNFMLENFNTTNTRNYRLTLSYNITQATAASKKKKAANSSQLKNALQPQSRS